jgi:hypothetical protein
LIKQLELTQLYCWTLRQRTSSPRRARSRLGSKTPGMKALLYPLSTLVVLLAVISPLERSQ